MDFEVVSITVEELEALRLIDVEGLRQGRSHQGRNIKESFWEDLKAARMKIALALSTGKVIEIKGGNYISAECAEISENTDT